jgi:Tfp pilus assembly protein PilF
VGAYAHWNNQGIELRKRQQPKEAMEAFQKAIDLNPTRPTPYFNMALVLFERQQFVPAENVFIMPRSAACRTRRSASSISRRCIVRRT